MLPWAEKSLIEAVKLGLKSLDRGDYVSHEEVGARINRLFRS
jgi:predicted transcriptional regulator